MIYMGRAGRQTITFILPNKYNESNIIKVMIII